MLRFKVVTVVVLLLTVCSTAAADRPAFQPLLQRAEKALAADDLEQAIMLYEKLVNFYPNSSLAHNRLGFAHYKNGNDPRAIYCFREALGLDRNNDEALHNLILAGGRLADGLARDTNFTEARQMIDNLISAYGWHPQSSVLLYYRGRMEFLRGQADEGLAWWKKAAQRAPQSNVAKVVAAQARPLDTNTIKLYRDAAAKVKKEPAFEYLLGLRLYNAGRYQEAYDTYKSGLEKSREAELPFPLLSIETAKAALAIGQGAEAITILEAARTQRPDWASIRTALWPAYLSEGRNNDAEQALQEAHELDPRSKFAILGTTETPVRLNTANGSLKMVPPDSTSLNPGPVTMVSSTGQKLQFNVAPEEALVYRVDQGQLAEVSRAKMMASEGSGKLAPPLVLKDRRGRFYRFADTLLKQPMLVLFWSVDDPAAAELMKGMGEMEAQFESNLETVKIHTSPELQKDAQRLYLSRPGTSAQLWGDAEAAAQFGVDSVPALVLIDRNGRIALTRYGSPQELYNDLLPIIETTTGLTRKY